MQRGPTGTYDIRRSGPESVRAFVPAPLPPVPPLDLTGAAQRLLERAYLAIGRLDTVASLLPDPHILLYTYVRKEALLSSQIEGTQSSLSELMLFELDGAAGSPVDDVIEVSNYVAALEHGLTRLREGLPLSNRLIREIHARLLARGRGSEKTPGEFRRTQNWIGGTRPGNAHFVPPPPGRVNECMGELERFLLQEDDLPSLVRAALAHVQFETIHPFLDGNGRVGRLLIVLLLCSEGQLSQPMLYSSLFLKQNRNEYYRLLDVVRRDGDWEAWIVFFVEGIQKTADSAFETARRLMALFDEDRRKVQSAERRVGAALQVHEALKARPVHRLGAIAEATGQTFPTVAAGMKLLIQLGIAREATGRQRNRVFVYDRYLDELNEGTENI